ncbi:hypothetical protein [Crenothrix sp.]|uniref:hypothetical protein n=1 Tax=Crenothrix sp. TaxID=3100433 RepID=UPI00374D522E
MAFHYLIEKTASIFAACPYQKIALPDQFSKIEHTEQEGVLTLENHFFQISDWGQLRIAHTHAPKINIIAVFFFPEYTYQLPVYSMEFVMLGQKPIIALMDTACLIEQMSVTRLVKKIMDSAHAAYPEFSQQETMPLWFEECRSGDEFFIRPNDINAFATLGETHLSLIESLTNLFKSAEIFDKKQAQVHKTYLENYKIHHKVNSPGIRLMNRSFGEQWTNTYLTDYLFA